ncbi:hypothetical protein IL306_001743 [Fusarium sp. DS 682]|nr:hypothetical protein IL306_001743 [Fusarium sp. DS 682]
MLGRFAKNVTHNRELGPGGVPLKDIGIKGRHNLVEALSDMEIEDDRISYHLSENVEWLDIAPPKDVKSANNPNIKPKVQVTVPVTDRLIADLKAALEDKAFFTYAGFQRRTMAKLRASVEDWLEDTVEPEPEELLSDDAHSTSSDEDDRDIATIYQLPKDEAIQKTKFNAPIFGNELQLAAEDDAALSSACFLGNSNVDAGNDSTCNKSPVAKGGK